MREGERADDREETSKMGERASPAAADACRITLSVHATAGIGLSFTETHSGKH